MATRLGGYYTERERALQAILQRGRVASLVAGRIRIGCDGLDDEQTDLEAQRPFALDSIGSFTGLNGHFGWAHTHFHNGESLHSTTLAGTHLRHSSTLIRSQSDMCESRAA